jgi:hypothetical protein
MPNQKAGLKTSLNSSKISESLLIHFHAKITKVYYSQNTQHVKKLKANMMEELVHIM